MVKALLAVCFLVALVSAEATLEEIAAIVQASGALWTADPTSETSQIASEHMAAFSKSSRAAANWTEEDMSGFEDLTQTRLKTRAELPTFFDARTKWSSCATIGQIRDQKHCGDCWAAGSISTMSDRECIKNKKNVPLSTADVAFCSSCGGCGGAPISCGFRYWKNTGIVTEACAPYGDYIPNVWPDSEKSPACTAKCSNTSGLVWKNNKYRATSINYVSGEQAMMQEIFNNGPASARFDVFEDFRTYSGGVYYHVTGKRVGGHVVKLVGWGEETVEGSGEVVKYWLIANSWGERWNNGGWFKMRRGATDDAPDGECGIEGVLYFGTPVRRS